MLYDIRRLFRKAGYRNLLLITAAVVMMMAAAVFFIYVYGKSENIPIQSSAGTEINVTDSTSDAEAEASDVLYVDISGCVKKPGVYKMEPGSRIFDVVEQAGGFTKNADTALINQAGSVTDGMKINVPDRRSAGSTPAEQSQSSAGAAAGEALISINTADSETLQQIPGIGPVTAEKIISYREENGAFRSVDEITNVSGIGDKTLEKIRSRITI